MRVGICGFPDSGKSTVFRALSPGGRIDRAGVSIGTIRVPDPRVDRLAAIFHPKKSTWASIEFMDVAGQGGRVGGALPSDVVTAMRNADVIVQVVRAFDDGTRPDPARDATAFDDEIILLDHGVLEKMQTRWTKERRDGPEVGLVDRCVDWLADGRPLRDLDLGELDLGHLKSIQLLSIRPLVRLYNLGEAEWPASPLRASGDGLAICGALEAEIAAMPIEDQREMLDGLGLGEPARDGFIRAAYAALDLISFLTAGEDECRAWPVRRGSTARQAAGKIHSDLERGFIRAEVYRLEDLEAHGSEAALKTTGKMRTEGKDYVVQDGDVMHVRFNV